MAFLILFFWVGHFLSEVYSLLFLSTPPPFPPKASLTEQNRATLFKK